MSKRGYISRYLIILKKLKLKPYSSFEELQTYFENQIEYLQMNDDSLNIGFSKRTFQRDIKEIRNLFGVNIEFSKSMKGYFISQDEIENMNFQRMIESFEMFNSLNISHDLQPFVYLEKRRPQGTENLYGLLHAIKNKLQIKFGYQKFWDEESTLRTAEPHALKEFRNRWYVLALDIKEEIIKSFALDRLSNLEITRKHFVHQVNFNVEENYRYSFGIIGSNGNEPEEIILSFKPIQGKYIKSLPLHDTQIIVTDNNKEVQVRLKLCITFDFVMELLSFGDQMKVIQPKRLILKIKRAHEKAFKQY